MLKLNHKKLDAWKVAVNFVTSIYEIARSSLVELDTQIEIAISLKYISEEKIPSLGEKMNHLFALLSNLIKSTN